MTSSGAAAAFCFWRAASLPTPGPRGEDPGRFGPEAAARPVSTSDSESESESS